MTTITEKTEELFRLMEKNPSNKLWYRNLIVEHNIKLVSHVLKQFRPYTDDQYQAGCLGLIVAVDTYKEYKKEGFEQKVPFANWACFCIAREIHKQHRSQLKSIGNTLRDNLVYLDEEITTHNGNVKISDLIPDTYAEEDFNNVLENYDLTNLFDNIIKPSIERVAKNTKGQETKVNTTDWITLELRYILELAETDSQKLRFNLSKMAKELGLSVQNTKNKHIRAIDAIKEALKESGYNVD